MTISTTTNLGLKKTDRSSPTTTYFNLGDHDDNWDTLDAKIGAQIAAKPAPTPVSLVNGLQVVNNPQAGRLQDVQIKGRTLVNLLGRDGNCDDVSKWVLYQGTTVLDTANKTIGANGFKMTYTGGAGNFGGLLRSFQTQAGKYYILAADCKNGNATSVGVLLSPAGIMSNPITSTTAFGSSYSRFAGDGSVMQIQLRVDCTASNQYGYIDAIRIYEITAAEYAALGSMTAAQIAAKYPYVDDLKHTYAPTITKYGENLLPPLTEWRGVANTGTVVGPYNYSQSVVVTGGWTDVQVPVIPNTDYILSFTTTGGVKIGVFNADTSTSLSAYSTSGRTFNTGNNSVITLVIAGDFAGTITNPMLNLGSTAKPFVPRNDDVLAFPGLQLASNTDQSVYDLLYQRDDKHFVQRKLKDVVLDGSLAWTYFASATGFKDVQVTLTNAVVQSDKTIKYDGKFIAMNTALSGGDQAYINGSNIYTLSISGSDSGWGDSYTPTAQEIQAYFWGWKMFDGSAVGADGSGLYNGTGTKAWAYRVNGNAGGTGYGYAGSTGTLPTTPAPSPAKWQPYRLTYQLATPTVEGVQPEGSITLHEGLNQLEVGQGLIVRERAYPATNGTNYSINDTLVAAPTQLRNRVSKILSVYKNGKIDSSWNRIIGGGAYGNEYLWHPNAQHDPNATYEVTYLALDQYLLSSPTSGVTGSVAANLKTAVDSLAINQADIDSRLTANESLARQLYAVPRQTTAAMTLYVDGTNGADNGDGSYSKPFKTIQKAINSVPQIVNHNVNINVAAGTYAEDVRCDGFIGKNGVITITGDTLLSTSRSVQSINISNCTVAVVISGFNITTTTGIGLLFVRSAFAQASFINMVGTATSYNGVYTVSSTGFIQNSLISNRSIAIVADQGSKLTSYLNTGSGNTIVFAPQNSSTIAQIGIQPTGTTLYSGSGGVLNPWGDNTWSQRSRAAINSNATQNLSAGTATKVLYQNLVTDNLSEIASSRFTAKGAAGTYDVKGYLVFSSGMSGSVSCSITIYKNGVANKTVRVDNGTASAAPGIQFAATVDMVAGDYIEIYAATSSATVLAVGSYLDITRIA
ncbi:hypothetical protein [Paenibacillus ferrarius]|uniref:hypothetical protein n=1 Tax=Paenibacillus ferrarius TaxID=1469647 RepID=UPI003D2B7174